MGAPLPDLCFTGSHGISWINEDRPAGISVGLHMHTSELNQPAHHMFEAGLGNEKNAPSAMAFRITRQEK